jgi:phospholipid transport system transporter-binding protein
VNNLRIDPQGEGTYVVEGSLDFTSVPAIVTRVSEFLGNGATSIVIDLKGVTRADSAGLALLVEWIRVAHRRHRNIAFRNIPAQMLAIAKVSGLERILPAAD